jgi:DnaK suppressor protein
MKSQSGLSPDQLAEIERELGRLRDRLERSLKATSEAARPVALDQTAVGRLSRIDALQNQHLSQELHVREDARHAQVLEALRRIQEGAYGGCAGCGEPIPFQRLQVFPETLHCASCADSV